MSGTVPSLAQQINRKLKGRAQWISVVHELPARKLEPSAAFRALRKIFPGESIFFRRDNETILGFSPFESIAISHDRATIRSAKSKKQLRGEAMDAIAARVQYYGGTNSAQFPVFSGGIVGITAYDTVRHFEPVLQKTAGNFRNIATNAIDGEFYFHSHYLIFKDEKLFVVTGLPRRGFSSRRLKDQLTSLAETIERLPAPKATSAVTERNAKPLTFQPMLGKKAFFAGIKKLRAHILAGDVFQAVLSEKFESPFKSEPLRCFEILSQISPAPYQFFIPTRNGAFFGASPEALLRYRKSDSELESHPIAGTRPRGKTAAQEMRLERQLLRSEKENAEHLMLVDLARNDLGRVSKAGTVKVREYLKLKKFGGVMHLVSRVTGNLRPELGAFLAFKACFPAGTLSGAPKIRAMEILSEIEPRPRGYYGGAVIAADFAGNLDSCIAIRCIETQNKMAIIQAGAGVVADSRADREYAEIHHKSAKTRLALALAEMEQA